jgi:hypothetical protein
VGTEHISMRGDGDDIGQAGNQPLGGSQILNERYLA